MNKIPTSSQYKNVTKEEMKLFVIKVDQVIRQVIIQAVSKWHKLTQKLAIFVKVRQIKTIDLASQSHRSDDHLKEVSQSYTLTLPHTACMRVLLHHIFRQIWLPAKCPVTLVRLVETSKDPEPSHHSVRETYKNKTSECYSGHETSYHGNTR